MFIIRSAKFMVLALLLTFAVNSYAQKMTAEEVLAKHLEAIGPKENRDKITSQLVAGDVQVVVRGTAVPNKGKGLFLSSGDKNMFAMNLASNDYPQDRFSFNGKETRVGFARPGIYSDLGNFVYSYRELLKEGLMGGAYTSAWALLHTDVRKGKISFDGTKKIEGKEAYALSYAPKSGSDLSIKMYFDKQTFQHIRTEYNRVIGASQGLSGVDSSASQGETRVRMTEDFSDFKKAGNLTLPGAYKISYSYYSSTTAQQPRNQNRNTEVELKFNLTAFSYNDPLEANSFEIAGT